MKIKELWERIPSFIKVVLATMAAVLMITATITGAMALTWETAPRYVLAPGTETRGQLVLYDIPFGVEPSVTTEGPFLDVVDEEMKDDAIIVDYTIVIPDNAPIDRYQVVFSADATETTVVIDVQGKLFTRLHDLFLQDAFRTIMFFFLLVMASITVVVLYKRMVKKSLQRQGIIFGVILLAIIIGAIVLLMQTNMLVKHPGTTFRQQIKVEETEMHLGSMNIIRNDQTPIAADWVSFNATGDSFLFYSIRSNEVKEFPIDVELPSIIKPGVYYYDVKISYIGEQSSRIITKRFRVVS